MNNLIKIESVRAPFHRCISNKTNKPYLNVTLPPNRFRSFPSTVLCDSGRYDVCDVADVNYVLCEIYLDTKNHTFTSVAYPIDSQSGEVYYIKNPRKE